ncbi:hypothetical protein [Parasitella parasitica]|uniref:Uncharacterized protein n=1 Tax=Parasitella parasitica TaxID=35722 RepID=A0A0B7N050_9FUNG|nr:hypothetical protein [Parasitella parasitica]
MSQPPQHSYRGHQPRGRGGGFFRGGSRGGRGRGGRGRGGFQHHHSKPRQPIYHVDVDYTPEAIEQRFSAYYLPSMTQDPWMQLTEQTK